MGLGSFDIVGVSLRLIMLCVVCGRLRQRGRAAPPLVNGVVRVLATRSSMSEELFGEPRPVDVLADAPVVTMLVELSIPTPKLSPKGKNPPGGNPPPKGAEGAEHQ